MTELIELSQSDRTLTAIIASFLLIAVPLFSFLLGIFIGDRIPGKKKSYNRWD